MTIKDIKEQNLVLFEVVAGSRAYGLDTETSDVDIKGVFYLPKEKFFGLEYIAQICNETNDKVYYELGRFVDLLSKSNPNILELLASPPDCILLKKPLMDVFHLEEFISKRTVQTFAEYASVQVKKAKGLNKKINNPVNLRRKSLLDFCFILQEGVSLPLADWLLKNNLFQEMCGLVKIDHTKGIFALFYDVDQKFGYKGIMPSTDSHEIVCSSVPKNERMRAYLFFNQEAYSTYCKSYREYFDWVNKRNEARFLNTLAHGQGYDAKNMMHTIRLLEVSKELLLTKQLNVKRSNRDYLLQVKSGKYTYEELVVKSKGLMDSIETLKSASDLKENVDIVKLQNILVDLRGKLYR